MRRKIFNRKNFIKQSKLVFDFKGKIISRLFWGRHNFYKTATYITLLTVVAFFVLTGLANRFTTQGSTIINEVQAGDFLTSGQVIEVQDTSFNPTRVRTYKIIEGDTLDSVAEKFNLKSQTVRWANLKLIGPFSDNLSVGWELKIPYTDGVLYKVKSGEDIYSIAEQLQSDVFTISELNNVAGPDYILAEGQEIMVPDGRLQNWGSEISVDEQHLIGAFDDPLSDPSCNGYRFFGSINSYPGHNGTDVGISGGCVIRSIAAGTVFYSGWEDVSGYTVKVDHGGGVKSYYYHGNGEIWVNVGDWVEQGQDLLYMGCTGNCFGTHLHLTIKLNSLTVDPARYINFRR